MKLTARQREVLTHAAGVHGIYPHTAGVRTVLENLWLKELVIQSCNGTAKWHATRVGHDVWVTAKRGPRVQNMACPKCIEMQRIYHGDVDGDCGLA